MIAHERAGAYAAQGGIARMGAQPCATVWWEAGGSSNCSHCYDAESFGGSLRCADLLVSGRQS